MVAGAIVRRAQASRRKQLCASDRPTPPGLGGCISSRTGPDARGSSVDSVVPRAPLGRLRSGPRPGHHRPRLRHGARPRDRGYGRPNGVAQFRRTPERFGRKPRAKEVSDAENEAALSRGVPSRGDQARADG